MFRLISIAEHDIAVIFQQPTKIVAKQIDQEKKDEAEASAKFADESPVAPRSEIQTDVYWEVDNDTEGKLKGTYFFND